MAATDVVFNYGLFSELDSYVAVKIVSLKGQPPTPKHIDYVDDPVLACTRSEDPTREYYVTCQLWADNKSLSAPVKTRFHPFQKQRYDWNEWISFPVKYNELPMNTQLTLTLWDVHLTRRSVPVGGTTLSLFRQNGIMRKGSHKLFLWPGREADGSFETATPSKLDTPDQVDKFNKMLRQYEHGDLPHVPWLDTLSFQLVKDLQEESKNLFLFVELPEANIPILFHEREYAAILPLVKDTKICRVYDPELLQDNPVEMKHRRLVRGHRAGPYDRDLKPNAKIRDDLQRIIAYPPTKKLSADESDLLWKFRFYLTRDRHALTKFLKCVDWKDQNETKQACLDLLPIWMEIQPDEALELLGPGFQNPSVRQYAIKMLQQANDEDLQLYLLQLVQAIKFEDLGDHRGAYESPLVEFLVNRSINNPLLGNDFHWYLVTECEDKQYAKMFARVSYHYMNRVIEANDGLNRRDVIRRQSELVERLTSLTKLLRSSKDTRLKKTEKLQAFLADINNGLRSFAPLLLPLDAGVEVDGILHEKAAIFKSSMMPLKLTFHTTRNSEYTVIFKIGDDLRQDQLIMQVIQLMDKLLLKENLDLKLTPYRVMATGSDHGMLQFVQSVALASIIANFNGDLQEYLRSNNPQPESADTFGIQPSVMDSYVRSCAGYCVITYLLGVGDRHLDNLLLTPSGHLFHIDFGYILGRDPKPFPPPMKLCKEMIDAMGGISSAHFQKFKSLCYTAFMILRKSSNLILNLFALMIDANIPDIKLEPDKAVYKVQEKFRLDLSDEEAIQYFQTLINDSANALFPQLMETVHKWAQYWRK